MRPGNWKNELYTLTNIVGDVSITPFQKKNNPHLKSIEVRSGVGWALASEGSIKKGALSLLANINYYLPMDLSGFKIGFNLHNQLTFHNPNNGAMLSFINLNLLIKTPLQF